MREEREKEHVWREEQKVKNFVRDTSNIVQQREETSNH